MHHFPKALRPCVLLIVLLLTAFLQKSNAQVVAGIMANGKIISQGDTVSVCKGSSIRYESAASGSLIINWRFQSGTPNTANGIGPFNVTYNTTGYDTTFQKVDGTSGFADSMFIIVRVSDVKPSAQFSFSPDGECANVPVAFTNASTGDAPLTYSWNFGDNTTSTAASPTHQFLSAVGTGGTQPFPVKLVVSNPLGCKDSITKTVTVKKTPDASLDNAAPEVLFGPFNGIETFKYCSTDLSHLFQFKNNSSTTSINTSYTIKWGDGSPDSTFASWPTGTIITHVFPRGSSTMKVEVTGSNGCVGIKEYNVFLGTTPSGGLGSQGNEDICSSQPLSFNVNDVANNPPGTQYIFYVNDGSGSQSFQHPPPSVVTHFFAQGSCGVSSSNGSVTYNNAYAAYLTITNPCGSKSPAVVPIYVSGKPRAAIAIPAPVVCVNSTVPISSASSFGNTITSTGTFTTSCANTGKLVWEISPSAGYTLVSGNLGSFGGSPTNGLMWTSGSTNLNVQFTTPGTYTIKLSVYNQRCGYVSTTRTICVRNPPQASFTMSQERSCGPGVVNLTNTSPSGSCQGDSYRWDVFYDNPQNCANPGAAHTFTNGTNATSTSPSLSFSKAGRYIIRLTTTAVNAFTYCPPAVVYDTFYVVGPPVAAIPPIPGVCVNNSVSPSATVQNCYGAGPLTYQWTFANGSPATSTSASPGAITYSTTGTHSVQLIVKDEGCNLSSTVTTTVVIGNRPQAEAGADREICSGQPVSIGMTPVSGVTYSWTPATGLSNASIANPTATLTYNGPSLDSTFTIYLTAAQGSNCSSLDSIKIKVKRKPVVTVNPVSAAICSGDTVQLTAAGALTYAWTPSSTLNFSDRDTVLAWPTTTTAYQVTGGIGNGCTDTKTVNVTVRPKPTAEAGNNQDICSGDPVTIGMAAASGITYTWTPSAGLSNPNVSNPTANLTYTGPGNDTTYTYYLTASLGSFCSSTDSVKIRVRLKPAVTASPLSADLCAGDTVTLSASGAENYSWTPAATLSAGNTATVKAFPTTTTTYTVTGSIGNGCTDRKNTTITVRPKPQAEGGPDRIVCSGGPVSLGAPPATGITYSWTPVTGLSNPGVSNPTANLSYNGPSYDTTYTFYVTASLGSFCSTMDSVKVMVKRKPQVSVSPTSFTICQDDQVTLNASGAETYTWSPGTGLNATTGASVIAAPTTTTTYQVTGSLQNGCTDTKQVTVTVSRHARAQFSASGTLLCAPVNLNTVVNPTPFPLQNSTYNWYADDVLIGTNTTGAFPSFVMSAPGDTIVIKLVALSAAGCKADSMSQTFITRPAVQADYTKSVIEGCGPLTVNFFNTTAFYNAAQYSWDFGNGITSNLASPPSVTYNASPNFRDTTYYITLSVNNGCVTTVKRDSVKVFPPSQARFNVSSPSGCSPFTVTFINTSRGNNTSYYWDFGDGQTDTTHATGNLTHTYVTGTIRVFTVRLISENRCDRDTQTLNIQVSPNTIQVNLQANGSQLAGCAPHTVTFNNTSVGAASLTWNFGDGSPIIITPNDHTTVTHTYQTSGVFQVQIRLRNNCSDTLIRRTIEVYQKPVASFNASTLAACPGTAIQFTNTSQFADGYRWFWGDGTDVTGLNAQHAYSTPGTYTVMMVASKTHTSGFACTDTARRTITILQKIAPRIDAANNKHCAPFTYTATAGGASSASLVEWFVSPVSNPQNVNYYTGTGLGHTFVNPGTYNIKLVVHTTTDCKDSVTSTITVYPVPKVTFVPTDITTCSHDTLIRYTATATYPGPEPLQYKWFINGVQEGVGNPYTHRFQVPVTLRDPYVFRVQALAQNPEGCGDTSLASTLTVNPLPTPKIVVQPGVVLQQPDYRFTFRDTAAADPNKVHSWSMGDHTLRMLNGQTVDYTYGDTGTYRVRLHVINYSTGCTARDSVDVRVLYVPGYLHVPNAMCMGCSNNALRRFLPMGKGLVSYRLRIYTTWGQKIFESTSLDANGSPNEAWDGTANGQTLQQDAYTWQIEARYTNGTEWKGMLYPGSSQPVKTGFITIIK
jgi:PKD repeat protein